MNEKATLHPNYKRQTLTGCHVIILTGGSFKRQNVSQTYCHLTVICLIATFSKQTTFTPFLVRKKKNHQTHLTSLLPDFNGAA